MDTTPHKGTCVGGQSSLFQQWYPSDCRLILVPRSLHLTPRWITLYFDRRRYPMMCHRLFLSWEIPNSQVTNSDLNLVGRIIHHMCMSEWYYVMDRTNLAQRTTRPAGGRRGKGTPCLPHSHPNYSNCRECIRGSTSTHPSTTLWECWTTVSPIYPPTPTTSVMMPSLPTWNLPTCRCCPGGCWPRQAHSFLQ